MEDQDRTLHKPSLLFFLKECITRQYRKLFFIFYLSYKYDCLLNKEFRSNFPVVLSCLWMQKTTWGEEEVVVVVRANTGR